MKANIEIENLKCHGCANTIKKSLSSMPGVASVDIDHSNDTVSVDYDESLLSIEGIEHELSRLGYPPKGENNVFRTAKSFVSCAIGRIQSSEKK